MYLVNEPIIVAGVYTNMKCMVAVPQLRCCMFHVPHAKLPLNLSVKEAVVGSELLRTWYELARDPSRYILKSMPTLRVQGLMKKAGLGHGHSPNIRKSVK